ncbi:MAG: AmmeMemoRadiSam system protein B [Candidatus Aminicenantes bacterium]|nr:AmmeMemoRadiSam system protein B [Candidatus Aminicenantes bacterium]
MNNQTIRKLVLSIFVLAMSTSQFIAQIPMKQILSRVTIPSDNNTRGLVDTVGFPHRAEQMDFIGKICENLEEQAILDNQKKYDFSEKTTFTFGICPHDDYMLAARVYVHVQRYIKAKTVILIGNAHWSETFGIRNKLIFGDFNYWSGPYKHVKVSAIRDQITDRLSPEHFTVNRTLVETEHSLEAQIPFLQYYNRDVEIVPILIPYADWDTMNKLGSELAQVVAEICKDKKWMLGQDLAILCSTDGQHYGDYGWSYYDYHPFGCDADGFKKATKLDENLVDSFLAGKAQLEKVFQLFSSLVDKEDISNYKITWCGRFSVSLATAFSIYLTKEMANRELNGCFLRYGTSLSDQWLPLWDYNLGITGDTNLHHFVTYSAVGFK